MIKNITVECDCGNIITYNNPYTYATLSIVCSKCNKIAFTHISGKNENLDVGNLVLQDFKEVS